MKYRKFGKFDINMSVLGFGCMRLPLNSEDSADINVDESIKMIRYAIDNGVNYVDTAYGYHSGASERVVAKALKDGYREKVSLATKFPSWLIKEHSDFDKYLNEQLEKLETDHIDFYLLHGLDKKRWENLLSLDVFNAINNYKKTGRIKHIGFSFHDDVDTFKKIVDAYDWDFCQIQYNYLDEKEQAGTEGLQYAASKGIAVVVMEPLRGGKLASEPPKEVKQIWDCAQEKRTSAEWALRWVWNHPEVKVVLSGMNKFEQVKENIRIACYADANSMTQQEVSLISQVRDAYNSLTKVGCTGCEYCMPCPFGVNIPRNFSLYNEAFVFNDLEGKRKEYKKLNSKEFAANCHDCGECEKVCPQQLPIRKLLKDVNVALVE